MKPFIQNAQQFGEAIRRIRKAQGLTQQELALTANTAPGDLSGPSLSIDSGSNSRCCVYCRISH